MLIVNLQAADSINDAYNNLHTHIHNKNNELPSQVRKLREICLT